uniref:Uncharacterized protein n=1 Tax=Romanomermis culicivorax TaxID=13658 RepID=A0A915J458_ROMCU
MVAIFKSYKSVRILKPQLAVPEKVNHVFIECDKIETSVLKFNLREFAHVAGFSFDYKLEFIASFVIFEPT